MSNKNDVIGVWKSSLHVFFLQTRTQVTVLLNCPLGELRRAFVEVCQRLFHTNLRHKWLITIVDRVAAVCIGVLAHDHSVFVTIGHLRARQVTSIAAKRRESTRSIQEALVRRTVLCLVDCSPEKSRLNVKRSVQSHLQALENACCGLYAAQRRWDVHSGENKANITHFPTWKWQSRPLTPLLRELSLSFACK